MEVLPASTGWSRACKTQEWPAIRRRRPPGSVDSPRCARTASRTRGAPSVAARVLKRRRARGGSVPASALRRRLLSDPLPRRAPGACAAARRRWRLLSESSFFAYPFAFFSIVLAAASNEEARGVRRFAARSPPWTSAPCCTRSIGARSANRVPLCVVVEVEPLRSVRRALRPCSSYCSFASTAWRAVRPYPICCSLAWLGCMVHLLPSCM